MWHYCSTLPPGIQHRVSTSKLPLALYLWIPWKVLLAISTMPPVGRATTPTSPFPIPLKNPAAPSFLAPLKEYKQKNKCFHDLLNHRIKPLLLQGNCFVLETAHSHWLHRVLLYTELSVQSHPLLPGLLRHITVHLISYQPLKGPELRCYQDSPSHTFSGQ